MSERGAQFMRQWLREHVVSSHADHKNSAEVAQLVLFCIGEARVADIHIAEIEEEYGDTIETIIRNELAETVDDKDQG
jgi:hypothetical protein